jgi:branched-chain amino acid transport system permease protein
MYGAARRSHVKPPNLWLAHRSTAGAARPRSRCSWPTSPPGCATSTSRITTLIFSQIFYVIIFTWTEVTGGENGLTFRRPSPGIPGSDLDPVHVETLHWFVPRRRPASYLVLRRITQSPFGMVLQSIRENEPRTRAIGYPVERYKIVA